MKKIKILVYTILKACGGFYLARLLYKRRLRILCYHGISINDQHLFEDILFIRKETFERRIEIIKKWGMNVISLQEAVEKLPGDKHPDDSVVITFDDGWFSTMEALPALKKHNYPSTIYIASYYALKGVNVFNVLMRYIFWKSSSTSLAIQGIAPALNGHYDLSIPEQKSLVCKKIIEFGNRADIATKDFITNTIAPQLSIDLSEVDKKSMFKYLSVKEMNKLKEQGVSLELHSHRHDSPTDQKQFENEISENRKALSQVRAENYNHFCYPSGVFSEDQFPWLKSMGIKSATTTNNSFNDSSTSLYKLNRILDRENMSDLEFEAEICGVTQIMKKILFRRGEIF